MPAFRIRRVPLILAMLSLSTRAGALLASEKGGISGSSTARATSVGAMLAQGNVSGVGVGIIPITFKEGDVISAEVINTLLGRLNDVVQGYSGPTDLVGTWSCTTRTTAGDCAVPGFTPTGFGGWSEKTQNITFSCSVNTCQWSAETFFPGSCVGMVTPYRQLVQSYDLAGNLIANLPSGLPPNTPRAIVHTYQKISPIQFIWNIGGWDGIVNDPITICTKQGTPPAPADGATATVNGKSVVLSWIDQSSDETGFKVQQKTSATSSWVTVTTTGANVTSFTDSNLVAGTYWYRIVATNAYGDGISSSEVQAIVK